MLPPAVTTMPTTFWALRSTKLRSVRLLSPGEPDRVIDPRARVRTRARGSMTRSGSPGLRSRTLRSFVLLSAQKVVGIVVTAGGSIVLARLLTPGGCCRYGLITFVIVLGC